jgi:hypothetical protein
MDQMAIIEKYETFIEYAYPIANNIPRQHGAIKSVFLNLIVTLPGLIIEAGKTGQVSKLYVIDAKLSEIRYFLRFLSHSKRGIISVQQHRTMDTFLSEVGKMLGAWIKKKKSG